jgi:hypothetical protein
MVKQGMRMGQPASRVDPIKASWLQSAQAEKRTSAKFRNGSRLSAALNKSRRRMGEQVRPQGRKLLVLDSG